MIGLNRIILGFALAGALSVQGVSQNTSKKSGDLQVEKAKISAIKYIYELGPDIPRDALAYTSEILVSTTKKGVKSGDCGTLNKFDRNDGALTEEQKAELKKAKVGSKIYIVLKYVDSIDQIIKLKSVVLRVTN